MTKSFLGASGMNKSLLFLIALLVGVIMGTVCTSIAIEVNISTGEGSNRW